MQDKTTYKAIKERQGADLELNLIENNIYRHFSTPFTWLFVKFGIAPNTITVSNYFICIIGAFLMSLGTYSYLMLGLAFFVLYRIMDDCDGETARIANKKSWEGIFFDSAGHYLSNFFLGIGIGIGISKLYNNEFYIILGITFGFCFMLQDNLRDSIKLLVRKIAITKHPITKKNDLEKYLQQKLEDKAYNKQSWGKENIITKIFSIFPFQGVIYSDRFTIIIMAALFFIESFTGMLTFFGYKISPVLLYINVVILSKALWFAYTLALFGRNKYFSKL